MIKCDTEEQNNGSLNGEVSRTLRSHRHMAGHTDDEQSDQEAGRNESSPDENEEHTKQNHYGVHRKMG